jgi:hypothetical protein
MSRGRSWFAGQAVLFQIAMMFIYVKIVVSCVLEVNINYPRTQRLFSLQQSVTLALRGKMVKLDELTANKHQRQCKQCDRKHSSYFGAALEWSVRLQCSKLQ